MDSPKSKKKKLESSSDHDTQAKTFANVHLYILPTGIGPKRLEIMRKSAIKNGFQVYSKFEFKVTHIVAELPLKEQVLDQIKKTEDSILHWKGHILDSKWLSESIKIRGLASELAYMLPTESLEEEKAKTPQKEPASLYPPNFDLEKFNACVPERRAVLDHPNKDISSALDLIKEYWELCHQTQTDEHRALAFARAAAAVKCLPFRITNVKQLKGIKDLGEGHALRVATEIVETGRSLEVEEKKNDPKFRAFRAFCNVYGVGPSLAKKWYAMGLRTIEDVRKRFDDLDINNDMIIMGLAFYEDLNTPLLRSEAQKIYAFVELIARASMPDVVMGMNGGFRRGKTAGHDLDMLFAYDDENCGLLEAIKDELVKRGLIIWFRGTRTDFPKDTDVDFGSQGGSLLLYMLIMKYPSDGQFDEYAGANEPFSKSGPFELAASKRDWRAVRVDLVGSTRPQYPFAQVGWTGNKQYNRCLRQYGKDIGLSLNSTGMYDIRQRRWLPAQTERDIFEHLKLSYREPWERNF